MSQVSNSEAGGAVRRLIWASRQHTATPDDPHWAKLKAASAEAMTAVLGNSAMMPCLKQLKELELWSEYRHSGRLAVGLQKGNLDSRVGQLLSQLGGVVETILRPPR